MCTRSQETDELSEARLPSRKRWARSLGDQNSRCSLLHTLPRPQQKSLFPSRRQPSFPDHSPCLSPQSEPGTGKRPTGQVTITARPALREHPCHGCWPSFVLVESIVDFLVHLFNEHFLLISTVWGSVLDAGDRRWKHSCPLLIPRLGRKTNVNKHTLLALQWLRWLQSGNSSRSRELDAGLAAALWPGAN